MFKRFIYFLAVFIIFFPIEVKALEKDDVSAQCCVVIDSVTNKVIFEKNAYIKQSMASTTKIMTCLLACESSRLNEEVTITSEMLENAEGTSLYLKKGDTLTLKDLVKGALLESGNDAANAIAVFLDGSVEQFCKRMNEKAREIGMENTNFETASGLDTDNHYSSAYDMGILASYACKNKSFSSIASKKSEVIVVSGTKKTLYNHNKLLLRSSRFVGLKTGYTKKSGRCLVSAYKYSASKIIVVTLNAPDDWNDHLKLVRYAKKQYNTAKSTVNIELNAVGAFKDKLKCSYSYSVKTLGNLSVKLYYYPFVYAPVKKGDTVGSARLYIDNKYVKTVKITADEDLNNG